MLTLKCIWRAVGVRMRAKSGPAGPSAQPVGPLTHPQPFDLQDREKRLLKTQFVSGARRPALCMHGAPLNYVDFCPWLYKFAFAHVYTYLRQIRLPFADHFGEWRKSGVRASGLNAGTVMHDALRIEGCVSKT